MKTAYGDWSAAGVLLLGGGIAACAALSGLDSYATGACSVDCDASLGAHGKDGASVVVADASEEASDFDAPEDTGTIADEAGDANEGDDAGDATQESDAEESTDSGPGTVDAAGSHDSGGEVDAGSGGCTSTDTVDNCGACGAACDTTYGTPTCAVSSCAYTCNSGRVDCNVTPPNLAGCECAGNACCGTSCETAHKSGITTPATYYNCNATGNNTTVEATGACISVGGTNCLGVQTNCGSFFGFGGTQTNGVCGTVSSTCYCWVFSGQNAGTVSVQQGQCTSLPCTSGTAWN